MTPSELPVTTTSANPEARTLSLYRDYGRALFAYALRLVRHSADAEDVTQEAFLRLGRHLQAGGSDHQARAWLYRVVTNLCHDVHRADRRRADSAPPETGRSPQALRTARPSDMVSSY